MNMPIMSNFTNLMIVFVCFKWFIMFLEINALHSMMGCDDFLWWNLWCQLCVSNPSAFVHILFVADTINRLYLNYTVEIDHLKNLPIFHMICSVKDDYEKNDVLFMREFLKWYAIYFWVNRLIYLKLFAPISLFSLWFS